ncbi:tRNA (adenosine(37)-N6)-threonylcarbamoyltransferase complex dimerization subunit type 1 TsaB [Nisaea acidiphila]|uniref:tRNA (Adenosine(37)-N6)-threonylcarbamoyltransferase complex dimerization subunit type 1 TsaB n=1 Tax=Nisaea acidiphila TaxID=1862145 RepID=A0A9J7AZC6_9PROT|nr:tRNA (adenosine(37)-N6)-threonylcarbamoyltransferase complex dimerization subunit type 1 TsaB [Nisaea acidiphila]UUX52130.1 tRNA (adenosine(37)-N6)-threonylcarbamoyltransferase complex dimerization subunit type 1 TsaB [Nisaea acidiphila]
MASRPRTILGIDSSTGACSVALCRESELLAVRREEMTRGQSERLAPMAGEVFEEAGLDFGDLDGVAVSRGPGSFTGVRIGLAFAKGLGQALSVPVLGITGFDAVARAAQASGAAAGKHLAVILESRRAELFFQLYGANGAAMGGPGALPPEALGEKLASLTGDCPIVLAGDAAEKVAAQLGDVCERSPATVPDAAEVAAIGLFLMETGGECAPEPLYLRAPDVTRPRSA